MLVAYVALATANASGAQPDLDAARAWVQLLDAKAWNQSWNATGNVFRSRMPQSRWSTTIQSVREPLGQVISRSPADVTVTHSLPGVPDGDYEIVRYHSEFANKANATETVVLANENGRWAVDGYFIR